MMTRLVKFFALSVLFSFSLSVFAAPALIPSPPQVAAKGYILIDAYSGKVIAEKNADERLEPASLTKMMTSYIADYELNQGNIAMDDVTTVSEAAWAKNFPGSSLMFLEVGKKVTVEELLKGVIISSGNDATVALAEHVAGSTSAFADIMNQHAELLGMKDSHFVNPHGLPDDNHYTTARDMATLAIATVKDFPENYKLYAEKEFRYNGIKQTNRNKLLWRDPPVDGLKTGYTKSAGYCLVASARKDDMRLVAVVMGAKTEEARLREAQKLLSYGFRYYQTYKVYSAGQTVKNVKVWGGEQEQVNLVSKNDIYVTVPRSKKKEIDAQVAVDKYVQAPVEKGQELGEINIKLGEERLLDAPVIAQTAVPSGSILNVLMDKIQLFVYQFIEDE